MFPHFLDLLFNFVNFFVGAFDSGVPGYLRLENSAEFPDIARSFFADLGNHGPFVSLYIHETDSLKTEKCFPYRSSAHAEFGGQLVDLQNFSRLVGVVDNILLDCFKNLIP